jgi:Uma2 family endonuclease
MTTAAQKLITAEEFARMPQPEDGSQQELIRGVIVTMPPPKGPHGACCFSIAFSLGGFVKANGLGVIFCNDTGFVTEHDPDTIRGADVAFWSRERLPTVPDGYLPVAPDLAVEVVSPDDHFVRIQRKVAHYLTHGVRLLWVLDPDDRSLTVYRPDQPLRILGEADTVSGEDVLPGFSCRVSELFP